MRHAIAYRFARLSLVVGLIAPLAGCLVSATSNEKRTGNYVADSTFNQIKPGQTTAGWIQATLGEPNSKDKVDSSNAEIWKYTYTEKKNSSGAIFLLFGGSDSKETTGHAYVEIKDGVVVSKWRG